MQLASALTDLSKELVQIALLAFGLCWAIVLAYQHVNSMIARRNGLAVCYKVSSQQLCQIECCVCSHKLEPIAVHIRCVGQSDSKSYQSIVPPPILARVPSFTHKTISNVSQNAKETSQSSVEVSTSLLRNVAHSGLKNQIEAVESIYRKTVRQLEQMAHKACIECAP